MRRDLTPTRLTRAVAPDGADRPSAQEAAMLTPAGADAVDAAELILLRDLLQIVHTRVESVRRDLLETRHHEISHRLAAVVLQHMSARLGAFLARQFGRS